MKKSVSNLFYVFKQRPHFSSCSDYNYRFTSAFTIVELLVVIVVIGILATITIVSYSGITGKANAASLQADLNNAAQQLKMYQVDHGTYPTSLDGSNCPVPSDVNYCLKISSGNAYTYYQPNNTANPPTFSLYATKNGTNYHITNDSSSTVAVPVTATGGTVTNISGYRIHTFTTSGTFTVTSGGDVEVLVVAGGGSGGGSVGYSGGGGGGGVRTSTVSVTPGDTAIAVGVGGVVKSNGSNSSFGPIVSIGGGAGGLTNSGSSGGSGGGGGHSEGLGGLSISGQGYAGGKGHNSSSASAGGGGGGGGVGAEGIVNHNGAAGGIGFQSNISGMLTYYAGGGGGGVEGASYTGGIGGLGGGGNGGSHYATIYGSPGTANTGGGGGGGAGTTGVGGSGVVIIRYPL